MALTQKLDNIKWVSHFLRDHNRRERREGEKKKKRKRKRRRREEKRKGKIQKGMEL